jgi:hypothetical protein
MKILIACEESQVVCKAFRGLGHEAYSCDVLDCSGGHPEWHIKDDVLNHLNEGWDLMIAHPPCTYLTVSAEWAYSDGPYHQKVKSSTLVGEARRQAREKALEFVKRLMNAPIDFIAIENPIGCISTRIFRYVGGIGSERWEVFPKRTIGVQPSQIIQPYQFGHDASKSTCLWLQNLPLLEPTFLIEPRIVNGKKRWANQTDSGQNRESPCDDRGKKRSKTYEGIGYAIAKQWSDYIAHKKLKAA